MYHISPQQEKFSCTVSYKVCAGIYSRQGAEPVLASGSIVGVDLSLPPAAIVRPEAHNLLASEAAPQALQEPPH